MWILVILILGAGSAAHSIEGFETRAKCEEAASDVVSAVAGLKRDFRTVCIEQAWEGDVYGGVGQ